MEAFMVELKLHSRLWELTGRGTEGEGERSKRHVLPCSMERHHWGGAGRSCSCLLCFVSFSVASVRRRRRKDKGEKRRRKRRKKRKREKEIVKFSKHGNFRGENKIQFMKLVQKKFF
jgi:hypothetical protein